MTRHEICAGCADTRKPKPVPVTVETVRRIYYGFVWTWACGKGHRTIAWERYGLTATPTPSEVPQP